MELVKKFLFYAQAARPRKGLLSFSLSQMQNECDASVFEQVMNGVGSTANTSTIARRETNEIAVVTTAPPDAPGGEQVGGRAEDAPPVREQIRKHSSKNLLKLNKSINRTDTSKPL